MSIAVEALHEALDDRTRELLAFREKVGRGRRRGWLVRRALLLADLLGLTLAFGIAEQIYAARVATGALYGLGETVVFVFSLPLWVIAAKVYGLYDKDEERTDHSTTDDLAGVFHLVTVCTFALFVLSHGTHVFDPVFGKLLLFWLLAIIGVTAARVAARTYCRRQINYLQNTIIVGAGDVGQNIARKLLKHPEYGINLVGFVDADPRERVPGLEHLTLLGGQDELVELVDLLDVERVILAFSNDHYEEELALIKRLNKLDIQVDIVPRLFDSLGPSIGLHAVEGVPLIGLPPVRLSRSSVAVKRALDVAVSAMSLLVAAPVLIAIAIVVKLDSRGPLLYRHERIGRGGQPFLLYKFRTMKSEFCRGADYGGEQAEEEFARLMNNEALRAEFATSFKLRQDPRVTRIGRFLRSSSLDEVPQLLNVLRGELSLVGPRALTAEELSQYYGESARDLLQVMPGVTGYWQINGRSDLDYDDRVRLDLRYITGWSLALDIEIIFKTIRVLISRQGAV